MKRSRISRGLGVFLAGGVLLQSAGCDLATGIVGLIAQELLLSALLGMVT